MNHLLLIVLDRGGGLFGIIAVALLVASLLSLPFMPLFHYAQNEKLKSFGGRVYGFLGILTMGTGLVLIPVAIFGVVVAGVIRYRGTGIPQSLNAFALGCAIWLATPFVFLLLGHFQSWFGKRLAPFLWDKKTRTAERRRKAKLRRTRAAQMQ